MIRTAIIGAAALLAGCATTGDDYQIGDGIGTVSEYQLRYCATADPYQRSIAIALLQRAGTPLPDSGICTNLAELLLAGELPEVDTSVAEANREWAQEQLEAAD